MNSIKSQPQYLLITLLFLLLCCKEKELPILYTEVCGTIKDTSGGLLQNVDISAVLDNKKTFGPVPTDGYGRYCLSDLESGEYVFTFVKDGYEISSKNLTVNINNKAEDLNFTLSKIKNQLKASPQTVDFTKSTETQKTILVENSVGKGEMTFSIAVVGDASSWLSVDKNSGTVIDANKFQFTVSINRTGITGSKSGDIILNGGQSSTVVTVNLTVNSPNAPTITINAPTGVTQTSAEVLGNIISEGDVPITEHGHVWAEFASPTVENNLGISKKGIGKVGPFSTVISPLISGKTYYVRAYAVNARGTGYSTTEKFETAVKATTPSINLIDITEIAEKTASVSLNLNNDGGKPVTEMGLVYSTKSNPTVFDNKRITDIKVNSETFVQLSGLNAGVTYFVRAFATNELGTAYSLERNFITKTISTPVSIKTSEVTNIESTSAVLKGNIEKLGSSPIIQHGIVWSKTNGNPTLENSETINLGSKITDGIDGDFQISLTDLQKGTLYYYRAFCKTQDNAVYYGFIREFATYESGLTLFYPFNNNSADFSESGNNAVTNARAVSDRNGNPKGALDLSSGAVVVTKKSYVGGFKGDLTMSFWVKIDRSNFSGSKKYLISKYKCGSSSENDGYYFYTDSDSKRLNFVVSRRFSQVSAFPLWKEEELADGQWHNIVYTKSDRSCTFFLDGSPTGGKWTADFSVTHESTYPDWSQASILEENLRIGATNTCLSESLFNGQIDEFRIYNFAMTDDQVRELYYR